MSQQYGLRQFSSTGKGEDNDESAHAATKSHADLEALQEKMQRMEKEIEDSAKANRDFVSLDGINFYDELKEEVRPDQTAREQAQTAAKNMSLKLLNCTEPEQVLKIFEEEFMLPNHKTGEMRNATGEELALILKFLQGTMKNTMD